MSRQELRAFLLLVAALVVLAALGVSCSEAKAASSPPPQAERFRRDLVRSARYVFGMSAPVAVLAAQVHQESAWRPDARSAYASGLAQFTPATVRTMARMYPQDLGDSQPSLAPLDPRWALLALCHYDKALHDASAFAADPVDRWAFALAGYNGGPGWIIRDRAKAASLGLDPSRWFHQVETVNAGRAPQFFRENRDYPRRILLHHQALYRSWGPGVAVSAVP